MTEFTDEFVNAAADLANGKRSWNLRNLFYALRSPEKRPLTFSIPTEPSAVKFRDELFHYDSEGRKKSVHMFTFHYQRPRAVVGYVSGWKGHPVNEGEMQALKTMRGEGYHVMAIPLEDPDRRADGLRSNIDLVKNFLLSEKSPLYKEHPDIPRILITHSTGSQLLQRAAIEADNIPPSIIRAFPTANFLNAPKASEDHPIIRWLYNGHANRHPNDYAGDPLSDRLLYYYAYGIAQRLKEYSNRPTHGQIKMITEEGQRLINDVKMSAEFRQALARLPQEFVISEDDSFACPVTAKRFAQLIGASILLCRADHNPLMNEVFLKQFIGRMNELVEGRAPNALILNFDEEPEVIQTPRRPVFIPEDQGDASGFGDSIMDHQPA